MESSKQYDVVVIGSGPGGYTAAIRAAQLGLKTAVVEKNQTLGGTCLNVGCIPAKALLDTTELLLAIREKSGLHGISFENLRFDLAAAMERKRSIVEGMTKGLAMLMRANGIDTVFGTARLDSAQRVIVSEAGGESEIIGKDIILATGSVPVELKALAFDGGRVIDSERCLSLDEAPESLIVVGAGAVGLELASIWARIGSKVTVVELADRILPEIDPQAGRALLQVLKKQGMTFSLSTEITSCEAGKDGVRLGGKGPSGKEVSFSGSRVLVAAGRRAYHEGLGLGRLKVKITGRGKVEVDRNYRTAEEHLYAIGDIIEGPMLAHKAGEEGAAAAEVIAGKPGHVNYGTIPSVVYTWPEAASAGMSEDECREGGIPFRTGTFYFKANGRAVTSGNTDGFVKIIAHGETDRVLGGSVLGPWASDLIQEIVTVMEFGGSSEDIARTVHSHPTLCEAVKEAALDADGRSINAVSRGTRAGKRQ